MKFFTKKYAPLYVVVLSLLVLAGCTNILSPLSSLTAEKGSVTLTVLTDANARTIYPSADFSKIVISFSGGPAPYPDKTLTGGESSITLYDFTAGNWTIRAIGYVHINGVEYPAAEGSLTQYINPDDVIGISISASQTGPDGHFSFGIGFPSVDSARLTIASYPLEDVSHSYDLTAGASGTVELPPGYYLMRVWLTSGNKIAEWMEIVHIYSKMETKAIRTFTDDDFIDIINPLTDGVWADDEITAAGEQIWYFFDVTAGNTYYIWVDDVPGINGKTCDVYVEGYYQGGASAFTRIDTGWTAAGRRQFTATVTGKLYLKVYAYYTSDPSNTGRMLGTYAVAYTSADIRPLAPWTPPSSAVLLTEGVWAEGDVTALDNIFWYSFPITEGTAYYIWWNERNASGSSGDNLHTSDINLRLLYEDDAFYFWDGGDNGWTGSTPRSFTAAKTGTVYLRVAPYQGTLRIGDYGVAYSTVNARPPAQYGLPAASVVLTADTWAHSVIAASGIDDWYSFPVTDGQTCYIWWNDKGQGNGMETGDVAVFGYDQSGYELSSFNYLDSGWADPKSFTADSGGTVYIRVRLKGLIASDFVPGSYGIAYNTAGVKPSAPVAPATVTPLTANAWADGSLVSGGEAWYSFSATAETPYYVWWNGSSSGMGDGTKTGNVAVSAYHADGTEYFYRTNNGWASAQTITTASAGTVYLRVTGNTTIASGSYGVAYNTTATKPGIDYGIPSSGITTLTADTWANGSLANLGDADWYSFMVEVGTTYRVWWNERGSNGNGIPTGDVSVTGYYHDGTNAVLVFNNQGTAWSTAQPSASGYTPATDGTIYLKVVSGSATSAAYLGTYGVVFSSGSSRPDPAWVPPAANPLTTDVWANGSVPNANSTDWYSFPVTSGTTYRVWWNDSAQGPSPRDKTGDVAVYGYFDNGSTVTTIINNVDQGWNTAQPSGGYTPTANGTVYLKVIPYSYGASYVGTYGVVFSENNATRPVTLPAGLIGKWVSLYAEEFTITTRTFSSGTTYGGYAGTLVNHRADGSGAGYITIQYTGNDSDSTAVGKYYVIHYEDLAATSVSISGAYSGSDPDFSGGKGGGKTTQALAESAYTVAGGYFGSHSDCNLFVSSGPYTHPLEGTWTDEDDEYSFIITDDAVICTYNMWGYDMPYFVAAIVNVRNSGASGYITIRYVVNQNSGNNGKFNVLYWENLVADAADMGVACNSWFGDIGEATQTGAESAYTIGSAYLGSGDLLSFSKE